MSKKNFDPLDELQRIIMMLSVIVFFYLWSKTHAFVIPVLGSGSLILLVVVLQVIYVRKHKRKLMESGIELIDEMKGAEFEELLMEHFKKTGYKARMTPKSADYGADLILLNKDEKVVVQAKRWGKKVGIGAIQQIVGAISYYQADKGHKQLLYFKC